MSVTCQNCGETVIADTSGNCPQCAQPVMTPDDPTMPGIVDPEHDLTVPPASSIPAGDAALLQGGHMQPPSRLGSLGRIGKFEIVKRLGQGGMAEVLLGVEPITGAYVALKTLKPELARDPRVVKCFLAEARHMYELFHPHILKVLEVSGEQDGAFFVMSFMAQGSLDQKIGKNGLPPAETISIASQVAEGLSYAHGKGLIHRDLKPANILLDDEGRALIADFGLVRPFFNDSLVDGQTAHPVGTPAYMSPRIAEGLAEDTRADIYAFGATLYEMLAGKPPYTGHDPMRIVQAVIDGPPAPLATASPGTSAPLVAVVEWCMARELRDRYASMNDVLEDLNRLAAGQAPLGPHGSGARKPARVNTAIIASAVILAALAAAAILGVKHFRPTPEASPAAARTENPSAPAARALYEEGMTDLAHGERRTGTDKLRRAHALDPGNGDIAAALISLLLEVGHLEPARATLDNWLAADPDSKEALRWKTRLEEAEASGGRRPAPPERRPGAEREPGRRDRPGLRQRPSSPPPHQPSHPVEGEHEPPGPRF
ncbi:MAG: protein kinase [Kiritimatiellae bacterium]|nr:protein kinase [Kiritimatiellia bacterium]